MCSSPKTPEVQTYEVEEPDPAPAPAEEVAQAPVTQEGAGRTAANSSVNTKKRGTKALRIDLNVANPAQSLNIPQG